MEHVKHFLKTTCRITCILLTVPLYDWWATMSRYYRVCDGTVNCLIASRSKDVRDMDDIESSANPTMGC